jgi:GNAT superfamily N-acetyltransferase
MTSARLQTQTERPGQAPALTTAVLPQPGRRPFRARRRRTTRSRTPGHARQLRPSPVPPRPPSPGDAEILWIAVDSAGRGQRLGTVLLDRVLDELDAAGVSVVEAKTLDRSADYLPYEATRRSGSTRGSSRSTPSTRSPAGHRATLRPSTLRPFGRRDDQRPMTNSARTATAVALSATTQIGRLHAHGADRRCARRDPPAQRRQLILIGDCAGAVLGSGVPPAGREEPVSQSGY